MAATPAGRRFNSSNPILQERAKWFTRNNVGAEHPTYAKVPGDGAILTVAVGGLLTGVFCIFRGMTNLALGRGK